MMRDLLEQGRLRGMGRAGANILIDFLDQIFGVLDVSCALKGLDDLVFEGGGLS